MPALSRPGGGHDHPLVPSWVRVLVILTVIPVWAVMMLYTLIVLDRLPGAEWTIVPSAIIAAVAPAWRLGRGAGGGTGPDQPAGGQPGAAP